MSTKFFTVFDPAMCCSTGVCGPEVDPKLLAFSADVDWLAKQGVEVRRFNMAQEPGAFAEDAGVKSALEAMGQRALPMIRVNGHTVMSGSYPTREQIAQWFDLAVAENKPCCGPKTSCC